MNERTVAIINELCKNRKTVTIGELAEQFDVSQRTIRNDLNTINGFLVENGYDALKLKRGGAIIKESDFSDILMFVSEGDYYSYKLSKEERKKIASALLVNSTGFITLANIADNLYVSRATVINDLEAVKDFIRKNGLEVISYANKGLQVAGRESDKRRFLMKLADVKADSRQQDLVTRHISVQAGNRIVIQKILMEQERFHESYLSDNSFQRILLYLGIMVNRNMEGEFIEIQEQSDPIRYMMAQDILKYISQYCMINTTEDEIRFLSLILRDAHYVKETSQEKNALKIQTITRQFINSISTETGINLNGDYEFFENLSNHLESVFSSVSPVYPENPVIDEVLEENQEIVKAVVKKLPVLEQYVGRKIQDIEMGYIAVHVCAALERKKNKEIAFHVIVACHAGIGTSRLLLEKLKVHFNFRIVDVITSHEARNLEPGRADFVISTVPLKGCKLDYVVVSPLLSDEDYIHVGNKIDALRNSRNLPSRIGEDEISAKGLIERLTPIVRELVPNDADMVMKRLRREIRDYFKQSIEAEAEIFAPYLHHLLPPDHIELDVECSDWKDAVTKSAQRLVELGYVEERYIDAMISNIEENGPYVVLSPGFAVPHEGLQQGSIKMGMNLIRLKNPVPFGAEEMDPVEFVCCLSAVDHKTHLKAFFNLVNMLQNQEFKKQLHEARTSEEAAIVIEQYEYQA